MAREAAASGESPLRVPGAVTFHFLLSTFHCIAASPRPWHPSKSPKMTSTEICNKALAHLGDARISDFHEVSVAAEKCRTHYDHERDSLLRLHRWNFARARTLLTRLVQKPAFGWAF